MTGPQTLIEGGQIATASGVTRGDLLISGEQIAAIGNGGWSAERTIDASGCYVLPGGIDVHTHFADPADFGPSKADDFVTGTTGAAFGGTTTIIDFAKRRGTESFYDAYQRRVKQAESQCLVDYSFHAMATSSGLASGGLEDLRRLAQDGVTSWKFFMAYPERMMVDDTTILTAMHAAAELGVMIMVHAENGAMVADETDRLVRSGRTEEHAHHFAHPHLAEAEATNRAIALSDFADCPLYVVHVSSQHAAKRIGEARTHGSLVWGETCPQYLFAAYEDYEQIGYEAVKYICSPPIRERSNQEKLWQALSSDVLSTVGTDHASFCVEDSDELPSGKSRGRGYFPDIPNGVPGVEERLMLMYEGGVASGRFGLERLVEVVSTTPAKLFGLFPRKGTIAVGSDADLVIWDPNAEHVISATTHHVKVDYTLYEGQAVSGKPRYVLSRGEVIVDRDDLLAKPGRGRYLNRSEVMTR